MRAQPAAGLPREPSIVQPEKRPGVLGPLGPYDGRDIRRPTGLRIRACTHRKCGERAGRQKMFQSQVMVGLLMRHRANDRCLMIWDVSGRNPRLLPQRRISTLRGNNKPAMDGWPVLKADRGTVIRSLHVGERGREQVQLILRRKSGVQGFAQRSRFYHEAERTWVVAGFVVTEMQ